MLKQKKQLTKREIADEEKEKDIWWKDSKKNGQKAFIAMTIFVLFVVAVVSTGFLFNQQKQFSQKESDGLRKELETTKKTMQADKDILQSRLETLQKQLEQKEVKEEVAQIVTIEGSLSYPGSYIPKDMEICAQDLENSKNLICTKEQVMDKKYTYGVGYQLEVAPGTYNVYAAVASWAGYKAYYDDFVTCGMKYGCSSHTPIEVKVESGKNLSGIDPVDWYKQN